MSLFLVTRSDYYYPMGGTSDWLFVSDDKAKTREVFDAHREASESHTSLYLIELSTDGWNELAEYNPGSEDTERVGLDD